MPRRINRNTRRALKEVGVADSPSKDNRMLVESDLFSLLFDGNTPFIKQGSSVVAAGETEEAVVFATDTSGDSVDPALVAFPDADYQVFLTLEKDDAATACEKAWVKESTRVATGFTIEVEIDPDDGGSETATVHWIAIRTVLAAEKLTLV